MSNLEKMLTSEIVSRGVPRLVVSSDQRKTVYVDNGEATEPVRGALETAATASLATAGYPRLVASTDAMKTLYLDDGTTVLPLNGHLYAWVNYNAAGGTVALGTVPANAVIVEAAFVVTTAFNAADANTLKVGVTGTLEAVIASSDISGAAGRKDLTWGTTPYSATARTLVATYGQAGTAATAGKGLLVLRYLLVPAS